MDKRVRKYHDFPSKIFCVTVAEPFHRGTLLVVFQKNTGSEKFMDKRGGVSKISVENFLSHSAEKIRREPFSVSLISGIEKIYASEG